MNKDFGRELIDTSTDIPKLKEQVLSKILKLDSSLFSIEIVTDEIFTINIKYGEKIEKFEIFNITPEALDVSIKKINEYVEGLINGNI